MKLNKLLLLSASALLLAGCGNGGTTSSTQSAQQSTEATTSVAPVTRKNFEHVLPANYQFEYSWETSLFSTTSYKLTKIGEKYLSMAEIKYNFFKKLGDDVYKHYHRDDIDEKWSEPDSVNAKRFRSIYLSGLYPTDGTYEKTGTDTVTIDGQSFSVDVYKDIYTDAIIKYYETDTIKLVLENKVSDSSDLTNYSFAHITKINESVTEFPIEVPQE